MMKNIFNKQVMASFEIILMVTAIFAFSYILYDSSGLIEEVEKEVEKIREGKEDSPILIKILIKAIYNKLKEPIIPVVSAAPIVALQCCERFVDGSICQNVLSEDECASGFHQYTNCEATSTCAKGCCIDDVVGTYDRNVPFTLCSGRWEADANCNVPGASFGCCVIGPRTYYTTQQNCGYRTGIGGDGSVLNWQGDKNEAECLGIALVQEKGACVLDGGDCDFTTAQECVGLTGSSSNFYEGSLCSAEELSTSCEKTDITTCVDGKDGVYFLDSCGNIANIYDADKVEDVDYWNDVVPVEDSCNSNNLDGSANSKDCGNCNRFLGGICGSATGSGVSPDEGDYYCADTSCMLMGETYENGESWCVYDGKIGEGDDIVGSRHWKYVCNQGDIQIEPCGDYRQQICVQQDTIINTATGEEFSTATCRVNNWRSCIDYNKDDNIVEKCEDNIDCEVRNIRLSDDFQFDMCTARYPPGFNVDSNRIIGADEMCSMASNTCTVIYEKKWTGKWKCEFNCDCEEASYTESMNNWCKSMGDCGGHVNILGEYSASYRVTRAPRLGDSYVNKLRAMKDPVAGLYAETGDVLKYLETLGLIADAEAFRQSIEDGSADALEIFGYSTMGVTGTSVAMSIIWGVPMNLIFTPGYLVGSTGLETVMAGIGNAAAGLSVAMIAASIAIWAFGLEGDAAIMVMIAAVVTAVVAAVVSSIMSYGLAGCAATTVFFLICVVVIFLIAWLIDSLGIGDTKERLVEFDCKAWQAPTGGQDCEKCNDDPLKPCSEYRCKSLGQACEIVNAGEVDEMCVWDDPNDANFPVISPINTNTSTFSHSTSSNGFTITNLQGGCLEANTDVTFGVKTDEPAQCRFALEMKEYDEMDDFGRNSFVYDHVISYQLLDPSHGQSQGIDITGDTTFYIKCQDTNGNMIPGFYTVEMCVNEGPDNTPPIIRTVEPATNSLVSFNSTEKAITVYTNEAADCKWSFVNTDSYDEMGNSFECENDLQDLTINGYLCNGILPINSSENNYFIKCEDQPWLEANFSDERNANVDSFPYTLKKPSNHISIVKIKPDETYEVNTRISTVTLKVETAGGGEEHSCDYSFSGYDRMINFNDFNFDTIHENVFNQMTPGSKRIYIECSDETGDSIQGETRFNVIYDSSSPQVARIFQSGSTLTIITTELADCVYSTDSSLKCGFAFDDGESAGGGIEHTVSVTRGRKYYFKCKDEFENAPSGCSIIVRAT